MCGISVRCSPSPEPDGTALAGARLLRHRGPDGQDVHRVRLPWATVDVGMARLAIVDRRSLAVPFRYERIGVTLAFNGEVYNHRILRDELTDEVPWDSRCDAEVVARAWRRWGPAMLERLNGMWGLVLVDEQAGEVFVARDRAGEKPVVYACRAGALHVASEAKALGVPLVERAHPDTEAFEFDCTEDLPYEGVRQLLPGHYLHLKAARDLERPEPVAWWRLPAQTDDSLTAEDFTRSLAAVLEDAIRIRLPEEAPAAVMLSGGVDSAILQAVARCERAYCVTFPGAIDNLPLATAAAQGSEPIPVTFGRDELEQAILRVAWHLDTPATWTSVCQWFLFRRMAEDGVRVALSGEGADELLHGYSRYRAVWWLERARSDRLLASYGPTLDVLSGRPDDALVRLVNRGGEAGAVRIRALLEQIAPWGSPVERLARLEWHTTMQCLLRMADRMASAHAVENRSPFLDHRVIALCARAPGRLKITDAWTKAPLREVGVRLGAPSAVMYDPDKRGLALPWGAWTGTRGSRGPWDRASFAARMRSAWREAFGLPEPEGAAA